MSGKTWDELLYLFLTNALSHEDRDAFEQYLASSKAYQDELAEWQMLATVVREDAAARVDALPPLREDFFLKLRPQPGYAQQSMNGSRPKINTGKEREEKMFTTQIRQLYRLPEQAKLPRSISLTMVAAVIAALMFGILLYAVGNYGGDGDDNDPLPLSGQGDQREQNNESATFTSSPMPLLIEPSSSAVPPQIHTTTLVPTATVINPNIPFSGDGTFPAPTATVTASVTASHTPTATVTASVTASRTPTATAVNPDVPFPDSGSLSAPSAIPPDGTPGRQLFGEGQLNPVVSITPSQIQPIIAAPAGLIAETRLPNGDAPNDVDWSPDGSLLTVAGYNGVWLFDSTAVDRALFSFLPAGGDYGVLSTVFMPDGDYLATLDWGGVFTLWDAETGEQVALLPESALWGDLSVIAQGSRIVGDLAPGNVEIINAAAGEVTIAEPLGMIQYPYLNDRGTLGLTVVGEQFVVADVSANEEISRLDLASVEIQDVTFSPDEARIALATRSSEIHVFDVASGVQLAMGQVDGRVDDLDFNATGEKLAYISTIYGSLNTAWLMNIDEGSAYAVIVYDIPFGNIAFHPSDDILAVTATDGRLILVDVGG